MSDLQETHHESFKLPTNKEIAIWRYMDLAKYLAMLESRSLFFARAPLLGDPFEGSSPKMLVDGREYVRANRASDPALADWKDTPESFFDSMANTYKDMVQRYLINCWHMSEHEIGSNVEALFVLERGCVHSFHLLPTARWPPAMRIRWGD